MSWIPIICPQGGLLTPTFGTRPGRIIAETQLSWSWFQGTLELEPPIFDGKNHAKTMVFPAQFQGSANYLLVWDMSACLLPASMEVPLGTGLISQSRKGMVEEVEDSKRENL